MSKFKVGDKVVTYAPKVIADCYKGAVGEVESIDDDWSDTEGEQAMYILYPDDVTQLAWAKTDNLELVEDHEDVCDTQEIWLLDKDESSAVVKPTHYNQDGIECIEAIRASLGPSGFQAYCKGNVMKYLWRYEYKNGLEDLKKAQVYLNWMVESKETNNGL